MVAGDVRSNYTFTNGLKVSFFLSADHDSFAINVSGYNESLGTALKKLPTKYLPCFAGEKNNELGSLCSAKGEYSYRLQYLTNLLDWLKDQPYQSIAGDEIIAACKHFETLGIPMDTADIEKDSERKRAFPKANNTWIDNNLDTLKAAGMNDRHIGVCRETHNIDQLEQALDDMRSGQGEFKDNKLAGYSVVLPITQWLKEMRGEEQWQARGLS